MRKNDVADRAERSPQCLGGGGKSWKVRFVRRWSFSFV